MVASLLTAGLGGVLGAFLTYGLSWFRERRRTLDAYRAPQRAAIADIVAATHELLMQQFLWRDLSLAFIELDRENRLDELPALNEAHRASSQAGGVAMLRVERAFQGGSLAIVDADCWAAMRTAYFAFHTLRQALTSVADSSMENAAAIEGFVDSLDQNAKTFREEVNALVRAADGRVSPVESWLNRRRRRRIREGAMASLQAPTNEKPSTQ
jgi:hypothetical protein